MDRFELAEHESRIWEKLFKSFIAQRRVITTLQLLAICGALVAAIGGGMEGPLSYPSLWPTLKGGMIFFGALASTLVGALLLVADRERPELMNSVRDTLAKLRKYVDLNDAMHQRETWRQDCDNVSRIMLEAVEDALLNPVEDLAIDIDSVLEVTTPTLLLALGIGMREDYTVSVFRRDSAASLMVRIAEKWFVDADAEQDKRRFKKGQGFTGQAWLLGHTIAVPDANSVVTQQIYSLQPDDYPADYPETIRPDEERFRSFACIPIMVGAVPNPEKREPWGILTVTSDEVGRFDAVGNGTRGSDNVPILRMVSALIALIAASRVENNSL